jgi:hypothetical protein
MRVVNFFAGASAGKSTTASGLFYYMKKAHYKVELIVEYAKECVYENRIDVLKGESQDQLLVLANQNRAIHRLKSHNLDWVISDSPLMNALVYTNDDYFPKYYKNFVMEVFNSYDNVNFYLKRNPETFQQYGRVHDLQESIEKDKKTIELLKYYEVPYEVIEVSENCAEEIFNKIRML